jgi:hypothetical protein
MSCVDKGLDIVAADGGCLGPSRSASQISVSRAVRLERDSPPVRRQQLTSLGAPTTGSARWSPDGELIAFNSNLEGQREILRRARHGRQTSPPHVAAGERQHPQLLARRAVGVFLLESNRAVRDLEGPGSSTRRLLTSMPPPNKGLQPALRRPCGATRLNLDVRPPDKQSVPETN